MDVPFVPARGTLLSARTGGLFPLVEKSACIRRISGDVGYESVCAVEILGPGPMDDYLWSGSLRRLIMSGIGPTSSRFPSSTGCGWIWGQLHRLWASSSVCLKPCRTANTLADSRHGDSDSDFMPADCIVLERLAGVLPSALASLELYSDSHY
jgi:hypothetical protein